jgi:ketosteroid isomerase-like protein
MANLKAISAVLALAFCAGAGPGPAKPNQFTATADKEAHAAIEATSAAIRAAYQRGDVDEAMAFHHPNVTKALDYNSNLVGADAVRQAMIRSLENYNARFIEGTVENVQIFGNTATRMTRYTIERTPKSGSSPTRFSARAFAVFVRYSKSPTGWVLIREIVQPAKN